MDAGVGGSPRARPWPLTRFFGRQVELEELEERLDDLRLLTLVGAPGCGKTRLSVELAGRSADRYRDGVGFIELAPVSDPSHVPHAIAGALGIPERPGRPIEETMLSALADREMLLVLDNCEHVVDAAADVAVQLLRSSPFLRILVTSRVGLGVAGEQLWRVPPLDPDSAVELFRDRAALVTQGPGEPDESAHAPKAVQKICRQLDGLPLAIELVAAWTRVLTPSEIVTRVDSGLPSTRNRDRHVDLRQQTIQCAVEWSLRLLDPAEQLLFDRLSVFAGSFDLQAAEATVPDQPVLVVLTVLVDHSLVIADPPLGPTMRYRLLEPLRQCGAARLAARGEDDLVRRRHADHYLGVAQRAAEQMDGSDRALVLARLDDEDANLRAALGWARIQRGDLGLELCTALADYWVLGGRVNSGLAWMDEMLEVKTGDHGVRAVALARAGQLAFQQSDNARAAALLRESLAIAEDLRDPLCDAYARRQLAMVAMAEGEPTRALELSEQSISTFRAHGDDRGLGLGLIARGWAQLVAGDLAAGERSMHEAMVVNRTAGRGAATYFSLCGLTYAAYKTGDVASFRSRIVSLVELNRKLGGTLQPEWLWGGFALAATEARAEAALRLAGAAEELQRHGGNQLADALRLPLLTELNRLRRHVGTTTAGRLMGEGARMSVENLMAEALAEPRETTGQPLSRREREVAELVAEGLTNQEIAARLYVSPRTVESHVDHIKQKLGLPRRAHIVAWAHGNS